jgi:hypothetical protein
VCAQKTIADATITENVMKKRWKAFQFVSSFKREEETRMNARDTVAECFATLASQVSF